MEAGDVGELTRGFWTILNSIYARGLMHRSKHSTINPDEMLKSMAAEAVKQHKQIRTTIRDLTLQAFCAELCSVTIKQPVTEVKKVSGQIER
jgi:hypothetical protein